MTLQVIFELPAAAAPPEQTIPRYVSVGAFFDRFKELKYQILASTNPIVKALVLDSSVRKYIDLDNPELPIGLQMIVDAGYAINVTEIISGVITDQEKP